MTKRQCLTCGYFQDGPTNGMGWCVHPKRKQSLDIKLYVRGGELPCRNDWNHDLWADKTTFAAETDLVLNSSAGPLAPVSLDDIVFLTANQRPGATQDGPTREASSAVDRVIREEPSEKAPGSAQSESIRGSVRRAHQHVRAEKRVERFADGAAPSLDGGFSATVASSASKAEFSERVYQAGGIQRGDADYTATRPTFTVIPPVQPGEMNRQVPRVAIYPGDEDRFASIPNRIEGVRLPTVTQGDDGPPVIQSSRLEDAPLIPTWRNQPEEASLNVESQDVRSNAGAASSTTQTQAAQAAPLPAAEGDDAEASIELHDESVAVDVFDAPELRRPRARGGLFRARRKPIVEPLDDHDELWDEVPVVRPMDRGGDSRFEVDLDHEPETFAPALVTAANGHVAFDEPQETALWADVPRMCRTCREFRPAETGDRGWCSNKWAFNHRRMVDADERPCDSSVGCWWLPTDDVWLALSDISAHGQPTPLLDAWLEQRLVREFGREPASIRRRQRG